MAELKALFGGMLRRRRVELGWSQVELAEHAGLSQEMVAKLERGVLGASFETVEKLAGALNLPAAALFGADMAHDPTGRLEALLVRLARVDDRTLSWLDELIATALRRPS